MTPSQSKIRASRAEEAEAEAETERGLHCLIEVLAVEVRKRSGRVRAREVREGESRAVEEEKEEGEGERVIMNAIVVDCGLFW